MPLTAYYFLPAVQKTLPASERSPAVAIAVTVISGGGLKDVGGRRSASAGDLIEVSVHSKSTFLVTYLLPSTYHLVLITYYFLLATCYLLLTTAYLLLTTYY